MNLKLVDQLPREYLADLVQFIRQNHGEEHVMTLPIMLDYYFKDLENSNYNIVCALEAKRIVGILGYVPSKIRWGGTTIEGVWTSHWTVDSAYRHGIGILLMKRLQELYSIILGQGANQLNKSLVTKMGHHFLDAIPRSVKIYNQKRLNKIFPKHNLHELGPSSEHEKPGLESLGFEDIQLTEYVSESNFKPDWEHYKYNQYGTLRDYSFLKKKYLQTPAFRYEFCLFENRDKPYLLVFRLERTSGRSVFNCIRIVEIIIPDDHQAPIILGAMLMYLDSFAREHDVTFSDFYCTNVELHKHLQLFGYASDVNHILPNLLNPIVERPRDQNVELFLRDGTSPSWDELYITKSDGDQDRPSTSNVIRGGKN